MRSITRIAVVSAAATALLLGSAATAMANTDKIDDRRYDVMISKNEHPTLASKGTYSQRIASRDLDVNDMKVNHGKSFVSIRINMHRLAANAFAQSEIRVNGGLEEDYFLFAAADGEGGLTAYTSGEGRDPINCNTGGESNKITGSTKTGINGFLQIYIPRACLNNPKHVKLGAASIKFDFGFPTFDSAETLAKTQAKVQAEPTNTIYVDPISSVLFGVPEYTGWLTRN